MFESEPLLRSEAIMYMTDLLPLKCVPIHLLNIYCDLSLELSHSDGSNKESQHMLFI